MFNRLDKWHKTKRGLSVFTLIELVITYGFASLAIDRGNPLWYLLTLLFLVGSLQNLFKLIGRMFNGRRPN
jgi:hypothetical protein